MNISKLSGSIFMVFVLISAPFFAVQTRQDGINRVLADGFILKSTDSTFEIIVASASNDNTVRKIDSNGNQIWSFTGHTDAVRGVAVDSNGNVYSASNDSTVRKLDSNGNQIWSFTGHTNSVKSVALDSNGNVYSASRDNTVRKIDSNGNQIWSFTGHTDRVLGVAVDSNGNVYSASRDNTVRKIDSSGNQVWSFTGHTNSVRGVAVDSNGNVYSASDDNTVRKIDSNGNQIWSFTGHTNSVRGIAVQLQQIDFLTQISYYDIFENARLANYSDVDGFTNVFYQIPRMASTIAETYNRFINFTDNLNPFRVRDESTGEFRDQTPSETMDSWPARIISWFRRFTD